MTKDKPLTARELMDEMAASSLKLVERIKVVLALHAPDEAYACGHCQTRLSCATLRLLDGGKL